MQVCNLIEDLQLEILKLSNLNTFVCVKELCPKLFDKLYNKELNKHVNLYNFLNFSCRLGHLELVKFIIKNGKGNNNCNIKCYCVILDDICLYNACSSSNIELVKYIVSKGRVALDTICLSYAYNSGNVELVKYIVSKGISLDI